MKPHRANLAPLLLASLFSFSGCAERGPLSTDPKVATREVTDHLPQGASETRAKAFLSSRGFQLSSLNPDSTDTQLIIGTYSTKRHTWQVGLIIIKEKVAARTVTVLDTTDEPRP
jgi:predicted small lipoprotein YifL